MKLKNKQTGEIGKIAKTKTDDGEIEIITDTKVYLYKSISEVCQHWEDAPEEPKKTWFIDAFGNIRDLEAMTLKAGWDDKPLFEFETKEEAERAVERLRAWKRLRDKGFRFEGWQDLEACDETGKLVANRIVDGENIVGFKMDDYHGCIKDLNICFGGEE